MDEPKPPAPKEKPTGYLIIKLREGDGVQISPDVEVVLCSARNNRADVAFRAPKDRQIKKVPK